MFNPLTKKLILIQLPDQWRQPLEFSSLEGAKPDRLLGILGEYLGRMYEEIKGRPAWIVRETTPPGVESASATPLVSGRFTP
jgi:hypothetical protein